MNEVTSCGQIEKFDVGVGEGEVVSSIRHRSFCLFLHKWEEHKEQGLNLTVKVKDILWVRYIWVNGREEKFSNLVEYFIYRIEAMNRSACRQRGQEELSYQDNFII